MILDLTVRKTYPELGKNDGDDQKSLRQKIFESGVDIPEDKEVDQIYLKLKSKEY